MVVLLCGLCAVCVRSVCGLCAVCVRSVCGQCADLCAVCVRTLCAEEMSKFGNERVRTDPRVGELQFEREGLSVLESDLL